MSTSAPESLPEDLIFDILLRLPVKSLLRFKSVCKSWCSMITGRCFASQHLKRSPSACSHHLVRYYVDNNCYRAALLSSTLKIQRVIETPSLIGSCPFEIIGTCDGIVCLRWGSVFLWNPATGQSRIIPRTFDYYWTGRMRRNCYGFGYSPKIDDYKLVMIIPRTDRPHVRWAGVFTLREGSWREVQYPDYNSRYYLEPSGTFVNGTLNWVVGGVRAGELASTKILSFDLDKDEFKSICIPPAFELADGWRTKRKLAAHESSLLFMVYSSCVMVRNIEIWMTNPRATQTTWTILLTIDAPASWVPEPLGLGSHGEIYLGNTNREQVVAYELSTGFALDKYKGSSMLPTDLYPYVESLVPLLG